MATYIQKGETLDYINTTENVITAGTLIVLAGCVGVAGCTIPAGETGSLHVEGVFELDLKAAASSAITIGAPAYIDSGEITASATKTVGETTTNNPKAGYFAASVAISDTTALVKINA